MIAHWLGWVKIQRVCLPNMCRSLIALIYIEQELQQNIIRDILVSGVLSQAGTCLYYGYILWKRCFKILYSAADIYWHCLMLISTPSNTCLTSGTFCDLIIYLIAFHHISVLLKVLQSTNVTEKQSSGVFLSQCHSPLTLLRDIIWRKNEQMLLKSFF